MRSMTEVLRGVGMLSKDELDREAVRLVGIAQRTTAELIAHLAEIRERRVALELGYSGLFTYCVERLGLSESQAYLRGQVAGVCRKYPAVLESLAANRMSLTVASKIAPHLTVENADALIQTCEGMTKREVEVHLVGIRPKPPVSSGYHSVPNSQQSGFEEVLPNLESNRSEPRPDEPIVEPQATTSKQAEPAPLPSSRPRRRGRIEPTSPNRCNFHFEAESSLAEKIERLAQVLGVVDTKGQLHALFETAVDIALEKKDPRQKHERRKKREANKVAAAKSAETPTPPRPDDVTNAKTESTPPTRHIPASVRAQVMADADYRCEFVGPDGHRCSSRVTLEADHVHPFAKGGRHTESNLRCLCRAHNRLHAEVHYGRDFIQRQIQRN